MSKNWNKSVWHLVRKIPKGRVASYGQLAAMLGHPRRARQVGFALHQTPEELVLPWHRVINARGKISFQNNTQEYLLQKAMLQAEEVVFADDDRIDLDRFGWRP